MSDDTQESGAGEIDALKWYVYGMVAVSVVGAVVVWYVKKMTNERRAAIDAVMVAPGEGRKSQIEEMADSKHEILAMLKAYKNNKEDEAREQPLTWFQAAWKRKGIQDVNIQPDAWKVPADVSSDGKYIEEKIPLKFSSKNPLKRELIGQFLHEVEHSSTRLRVITLQVRRAGREDTLADDSWTGQCEVGYRYPKL